VVCFKATSCRLWFDRYNLQGASFGVLQVREGAVTISGSLDQCGDPSCEASMLEEVQEHGNPLGVISHGCEIQSWMLPSLWCSNRDKSMSARCVHLRKGRRCKKGRLRGIIAHQNRQRPLVVWWHGDLWLWQPGGVVARVLERGRCR
jgi:hypothetical protein